MIPEPVVSILTPVFNNRQGLAWLAKGLFAWTPAPDWEWILVDNHSTEPGMNELYTELAAQEQVVILRNSANLGFGRANNQALAVSRGEVVVLLNSDMFPLGPWLPFLVARLRSQGDCGAVQAKILLPTGDCPPEAWRVQTCGGRIDPNGLPQYFLPDLESGDPAVNQVYRMPVFMGAGVALHRAAIEAVGFFDPDYDLVFMEDTDLALRLLGAGWQILYEPRAVLGHFHSASMPYLSQEAYDRSRRHNLRLFQEKWPLDRLGPLLASQGFSKDPEHGWEPDAA